MKNFVPILHSSCSVFIYYLEYLCVDYLCPPKPLLWLPPPLLPAPPPLWLAPPKLLLPLFLLPTDEPPRLLPNELLDERPLGENVLLGRVVLRLKSLDVPRVLLDDEMPLLRVPALSPVKRVLLFRSVRPKFLFPPVVLPGFMLLPSLLLPKEEPLPRELPLGLLYLLWLLYPRSFLLWLLPPVYL